MMSYTGWLAFEKSALEDDIWVTVLPREFSDGSDRRR